MRRRLSETKRVGEGWWHDKKWQTTEGKMSATEGATSETYDWAPEPNFEHSRTHTNTYLSLPHTHVHEMDLQASPADFSLLTWLTLPHRNSPATWCRQGAGWEGWREVERIVKRKGGNDDRKEGEKIRRKKENGRKKAKLRGFRGSHEAPMRSVG